MQIILPPQIVTPSIPEPPKIPDFQFPNLNVLYGNFRLPGSTAEINKLIPGSQAAVWPLILIEFELHKEATASLTKQSSELKNNLDSRLEEISNTGETTPLGKLISKKNAVMYLMAQLVTEQKSLEVEATSFYGVNLLKSDIGKTAGGLAVHGRKLNKKSAGPGYEGLLQAMRQ